MTRLAKLLVLGAAVLLYFCIVSAAHGERTEAELPGIEATDDPLLLSAIEVADSFWLAHGYATCAAALRTYGDEPGIAARAPLGGCAVYVERNYLASVETLLASPAPRFTRRRTYRDLCDILVHERGHNLGFYHEAGTVMDEANPVPVGACIDWSIQMTPANRLTGNPSIA